MGVDTHTTHTHARAHKTHEAHLLEISESKLKVLLACRQRFHLLAQPSCFRRGVCMCMHVRVCMRFTRAMCACERAYVCTYVCVCVEGGGGCAPRTRDCSDSR